MKGRGRGNESRGRYSLRFGATALALISGTLVLVLVVLPERYVLRPGFRESGMSFPDPTVPFEALPIRTVAARWLPEPPAIELPGPSEAFWQAVLPLLESDLHADALPVFDRYLRDNPYDVDARRERAVALVAADRIEDAIDELRRLLELTEDPEARLLLARMLRDEGRTDEAAAEYARLAASRTDDVGLALEHAQTYAWVERYAEAADVLEATLARHPEDARVRVELAGVYFAAGRLTEARALLAALDERALAEASGTELRDAVAAALYVPPPPPAVPPTLLEQAVAAREADDFARARALFEEALRESPSDPTVWQAYADLLEYELGDLEAAHAALLEVERLTAPDPDLQYRIALLEIWTGQSAEAEARLEALLASGSAAGSTSRADVQAALGDLDRWQGDRIGAASRYDLALLDDPENARALEGLAALEEEVARTVAEVERPRRGGMASSLADSDEFARVDLGGEWVDTDGRWVWDGAAGSRWVSGFALDGAEASRGGAYVELGSARWWRWGTVRTGFDFAAERLGTSWLLGLGASVSLRGSGVTDLRIERGPAHPVAVTLQSVLARVVHERVVLSHARPLGERWSVAATAEGARLSADADSVIAGGTRSTYRVQAALDVGREFSASPTTSSITSLRVGATASSLVVTRPAPQAPLSIGGSRRLFWDPRFVVAAGPYARLSHDLTESWTTTARFVPGIALIEERGAPGSNLVPHLAAEAGVRWEGARLSASLDLFYGQGQFDGYRAYGARLTVSALALEGARGP